MAITIPIPARARARLGAVPRIWQGVQKARRFPLFPIGVLLIVLVIPAISADWISPYDPRVGDLSERLVPPAWSGDKVVVKTVVEQVNRNNFQNEILLSDALRKVRIGEAKLVVAGAADRPAALGDQVSIVAKRGGSMKHIDRKSTRLNSSHIQKSRMPSSA